MTWLQKSGLADAGWRHMGKARLSCPSSVLLAICVWQVGRAMPFCTDMAFRRFLAVSAAVFRGQRGAVEN